MGTAPVLPEGFAATRTAIQAVAAHVLARRRRQVTGRIGLRPSPGGIATPAFGDDAEVLRTDGDLLVHERAGRARCVRMTDLATCAELAGVDLSEPLDVGADAPPLGDPSAPLAVDAGAARALGDWFAMGVRAIDAAVAAAGSDADASVTQIWPEHFDVAADLAWGAGEGQRVNLGLSPGDAAHPEPYLYVGPWGDERPGDRSYWNAPFGAEMPRAALRWAPDPEAAAVAFLVRGLTMLRG